MRATNALSLVAFGTRMKGPLKDWLEVRVSPAGRWSLHRLSTKEPFGQFDRSERLLAQADSSDAALAAGQWVNIAAISVGASYELWINGRSVARGTDSTGVNGASDFPNAMQLGGTTSYDGRARVAVDYAAVWDLGAGPTSAPPASSPDYALAFDGKSKVTLPLLPLDLSGPLTLEGYATLTQQVVGHQAPFTALNRMFVEAPGGKAWAMSGSGTKAAYSLKGPPVEVNRRVHLAAVYDGERYRLFVNGKRFGEAAVQKQNPPNMASTPLQIGYEFTGLVQEVRVSRVARYADDFTPSQRFTPDKDTLGLYHCDENSGDVLKDSSGHGHDGKIVGAKWVKVEGPANGTSVDLLALIDAKRDTVSGRWKMVGGKLEGGGDTTASAQTERLQIPYAPPAEYDMTLVVEREKVAPAGDEKNFGPAFSILCPGPGPCQLVFGWDHEGTAVNGVQLVAGKRLRENPTKVVGDPFKTGGPAIRVECRIRRDSIAASVDDRELFSWKGNPADLSVETDVWGVPDKTRLGLGVQNARYRVSKWTVTPVADVDRQVAEWVLNSGGQISIDVDGTGAVITKTAQLPAGPFDVWGVGFAAGAKITDADFAPLRGLRKPTALSLARTAVTDEVLVNLREFPALTNVDLSYTRVSGAGLEHLAPLKGLLSLYLHEIEPGPTGLRHLRSLGNLERLLLGGVLRVTDADVEAIAALPKLQVLELNAQGLTDPDAALKKLAALRELRDFQFVGPARVTEAGFAHVAKLTALTHLNLSLTGITDRSLAALRPLQKLEVLHLGGAAISNAGAAEFRQFPRLKFIGLSGESFGDAGLEPLKDLKPLTSLVVSGTKVTDVGARKFAAARPDCRIAWDGGVIEPKVSPSSPPRYKNDLGMEFALVPKGKAWLGGGGGKPGDRVYQAQEDFYLGVYEVTQDEWRRVLGNNPSIFSRKGNHSSVVEGIPDAALKRFPVEWVSWDDAQRFLKALNEQAKDGGWEYRLPTADEWEYACRGGPMADPSESAFDYYLDKPSIELQREQANFTLGKTPKFTPPDGGIGRPCEVGTYKPNKLGLYDMHGNVYEWTADVFQPNPFDKEANAVNRRAMGGSWFFNGGWCKPTAQYAVPSNTRQGTIGLRVARVRVSADSSRLYLYDLKELDVEVLEGKFKNGWDEQGITVKGVRYKKGLWMHPFADKPATAKFKLDGLDAVLFEAKVAINDTALDGAASPVTFEVIGDGKELWKSKPVQVPHQTQDCRVKVEGVRVLELRVSSQKDHRSAVAVWVDPVLTAAEKSTPDRRAAEWVLSIDGIVRLDGKADDIKAGAGLPKEPFRLTYVYLNENKQLTDTGLATLKDCRHLAFLHLGHSQVTDAGLAHLKGSQTLAFLDLYETGITDTGLAQFKGCTHLTYLNVGVTQVTDEGLAHFKDCRELIGLGLNGAKVTNTGLAVFKDCPNLHYLDLVGTKVTDEGLALFSGCRELDSLGLENTQVTDASLKVIQQFAKLQRVGLAGSKVTKSGVEKLAAALPKCKIEWDGGTIQPAVEKK
jgi:formylglycine-generating enzyme required for sulfatase activity